MSHEGTMRHYFILVNDGETYSIENGHRFKALIIVSLNRFFTVKIDSI